MFIVVDLIIVAIIALFTFLGYKRGLVKLAFHLCTFLIAIILAFVLYKPVANLVIEKTGLDESIETSIVNRFVSQGLSEDSPATLTSVIPSIFLKSGEGTVKTVAVAISHASIEIVCFLGIYFIVRIILRFITALADLIAKIPLLKQFNEVGGIIYGVLEGLLIVFVILAIISLIAPLLDSSILSYINDSIIGSFLYNNNILLKLFA